MKLGHCVNRKLKTKYFVVFLQIFTHFEFDACNMFQKSCNRGNKRLGKLMNAQKTPVWYVSQVNRLIGNRSVS